MLQRSAYRGNRLFQEWSVLRTNLIGSVDAFSIFVLRVSAPKRASQ